MKLFSFGDKKDVPEEESSYDDGPGRNRVFYVRDQGLVTQWYLAKRCEEECYRSERYDRPLSFILIELLATTDTAVVQRQVGAWVRKELRVTDIPARLSGRRYAALLVETSLEEATIIAGRLRAAVRNVRIGLSHFPEDGATLDRLIAAAANGLGEDTLQAA